MVSYEQGKKKQFLVLPVFTPYSLSLASSLFMLNSQCTPLIWRNLHSYLAFYCVRKTADFNIIILFSAKCYLPLISRDRHVAGTKGERAFPSLPRANVSSWQGLLNTENCLHGHQRPLQVTVDLGSRGPSIWALTFN